MSSLFAREDYPYDTDKKPISTLKYPDIRIKNSLVDYSILEESRICLLLSMEIGYPAQVGYRFIPQGDGWRGVLGYKEDEDVMDDSRLIYAAQKGDVEAFNQLVLKYQDLVYNHACATLGEPELAEDITQEVFIKAYRGLGSYRGGSWRAWLLRIASNACYDEFRRRKKQSVAPLADITPDDDAFDMVTYQGNPGNPVEAHLERAELQDAIQRGLASLPPEYRMAAVVIDMLGFDYAEAARSLGVPLGTVKSRLARARLGLREYLNGALELAG